MIRILILTAIAAFHTHVGLAQSVSPSNEFDALTMPQRERDFIGIVARAQDKLGSVKTDESRRSVRIEMQIDEANFAKQTQEAVEWVGIVQAAGTDRDGFAWVSVEIWPGIMLSTANSREVDPRDQTLIPAGTQIYQIASRLKTGQVVEFSANLIGGRLGTDEEMVRHPEVTVHFTSLKPTD